MIINPMIPVWLMTVICIIAILLVLYSERFKRKILKQKDNIENIQEDNTKDILKKSTQK